MNSRSQKENYHTTASFNPYPEEHKGKKTIETSSGGTSSSVSSNAILEKDNASKVLQKFGSTNNVKARLMSLSDHHQQQRRRTSAVTPPGERLVTSRGGFVSAAVKKITHENPRKRARLSLDSTSTPMLTEKRMKHEEEARSPPAATEKIEIVHSPIQQRDGAGEVSVYYYIEQEASCLPRQGDGSVLFPNEEVYGVELDCTQYFGPSSKGQPVVLVLLSQIRMLVPELSREAPPCQILEQQALVLQGEKQSLRF